ncbi:hypothetical protein PR048_023956 [Dryococelus australis]|uniref:DUF7869 domain-containing protein n=1 Tax=Dryococelus australis TaxID=614101 RepID=A0ABQ9GVK2_9NEOP|nr:hypothetical protein PR048_023956 [Dryococelus australis]
MIQTLMETTCHQTKNPMPVEVLLQGPLQNSASASTQEKNVLDPETFTIHSRGRKCVREGAKRKREVAKRLRNSGKSYIVTRGIIKPARQSWPFNHNCQYKCNEFISEQERQTLLTEYFALGSRRVATKKSENGISPRDKRGQSTPRNKIPEHQIQFVKKHIESITKIVFEEQNETPVKEWAYRHIFNTQFSLGFNSPSSDTCSKCDKFDHLLRSCGPDTEEKMEIERGEKKQKKTNTERASTRTDTIAIVFDLQKTLPTPRLSTNNVCYLRQLWTYNCGIHNLVTGKARMFMRDESTAKRGSQEVGSCLVNCINSLDDEIKHVIAYADCCAGQNSNVNIVKFWTYIVEGTNIETVHHKFLEPGHTFNECDQDFGLTEKRKRNEMHVYVPDNWVDVVRREPHIQEITAEEEADGNGGEAESADEVVLSDESSDILPCDNE